MPSSAPSHLKNGSIGGSAYFDVGPGSAIPFPPRLGVGCVLTWPARSCNVRDGGEVLFCLSSAPVSVNLGS